MKWIDLIAPTVPQKPRFARSMACLYAVIGILSLPAMAGFVLLSRLLGPDLHWSIFLVYALLLASLFLIAGFMVEGFTRHRILPLPVLWWGTASILGVLYAGALTFNTQEGRLFASWDNLNFYPATAGALRQFVQNPASFSSISSIAVPEAVFFLVCLSSLLLLPSLSLVAAGIAWHVTRLSRQTTGSL